jgi:hypothetical protein
MIIVKLNGGLGNQMFQYAIGKHLAIKRNTRLKLDLSFFETQTLRSYQLDVFCIAEEILTAREYLHYFPQPSSNIFKNIWRGLIKKLYGYEMILEKHFNFQPQILNLKGNVYLDGYWQSEKYFKEVENTIRACFRLKEGTPKAKDTIDKIKECNAVAIHFRRGDYVDNTTTNKVHGTCSPEYYQKAITFIADKIKEPVFFIFSDDLNWVKNNFQIAYEHYFVEEYEGHRDMELMSLCKHNIIANSSFSWWGAWLNENPDKIVIAPMKWMNIRERNTDDLIPDSWIKIS